MGGDGENFGMICTWQCTDLKVIALAVGVGLLAFIIWYVLCLLDAWSYDRWKRGIDK
jgi:hypothetical protein